MSKHTHTAKTHQQTHTPNPAQYDTVDVVILGAGAAGLFCAWQLGKLGKRVLVLDHASKAGKKILMSGGGKCNFTNLSVEPENYISQNAHFCKSALSRYTNWDFIALVEAHGIGYEERDLGKLFCTQSAKDILTMLLDGCAKSGARVQLNTSIELIDQLAGNTGFELTTSKGSVKCQKLVVATGGLSIPTMGATGFGYTLATEFGHTLVPRQAALVPFTFTDHIGALCKALSGIAIEVTASNARASFTEPMLFTHRGLSGPAMLQLSSYWRTGECIIIDLLPTLDASVWLLEQKRAQPKVLLKNVLSSQLPKRVAAEITHLLAPSFAGLPLTDISDKTLTEFAKQVNNWTLKPAGSEGWRTAEATLGGVCVSEVSSKTMQSKLVHGLYFIGEVLDVTGQLGGYNFQWAWASGYVCAHACAQEIGNK